MVSLARFEPTTFRLGGERSILLSYRDNSDIFKATADIIRNKKHKPSFSNVYPFNTIYLPSKGIISSRSTLAAARLAAFSIFVSKSKILACAPASSLSRKAIFSSKT